MSQVYQPSGLPESNPTRAEGLLADLHLDLPLLTGLILLCGFGLVVLYSANDQDMGQIQGQLLRLGTAFAAMFVLAQVPPASLRRWSPWLFGIATILLIAVLLIGDVGKGAQRWLDLGVIRFQPSEMMKVALVLALARYYHDLDFRYARGVIPWAHIPPLVAVGLPAALIAMQPDLGTAVLVVAAGVVVIFLSGVRWTHIGLGAVGGVANAS